MPYYDYTDEFRELISNSEAIIENQEKIIENQETTNSGIALIIFSIIFYITLTSCRRLFSNK